MINTSPLKHRRFVLAATISLIVAGCGPTTDSTVEESVEVEAPKAELNRQHKDFPARRADYQYNGPTLPDIDTSVSANGIVPLPDNVEPFFKFFNRYSKVLAPNGKPIHILIEEGYTDQQAVYARKVLESHLTNQPGTRYGHDKSAIANAIADRHAILALYHSEESLYSDAAQAFHQSGVNSQDLRAYETILEGTPEYMDQEDPTRDASYEEILHFVQDYGIYPAHDELDDAIEIAFASAKANNLYQGEAGESNEYIVTGLEAFFDMWKHDPTGDGTREGEYIPISKETLREKDPAMYTIIDEFFGRSWSYVADIDAGFDGTFSLTYDDDLTYTNKSQHLSQARLTGDHNSNLIGNNKDNFLYGNQGDNEITPRQGIDYVDGGEGVDTVIFPGDRNEYAISRQRGAVVVNSEAEGDNQLYNIEKLKFDDQLIDTADIAEAPLLIDIDISQSPNGVVDMPANAAPAFRGFAKYTKVMAPNGKPIHIGALPGVPEIQVAHARDILESHLTSVPGSLYGSDKTVIANTMADRQAILTLSSEQTSEEDFAVFESSGMVSQGLGDGEMVREGTPAYMDEDPQRNAAYEEILHFVHDQGIIPSQHGLQKALYKALDDALEKDIYNPGFSLPRGSYTQEYLVVGMEAYFGLWQHKNSISFGEYAFTNREDLKQGDPQLYAIIEGFFNPYWDYTAKVDSDFDGEFSLQYSPDKTYTNKTQYLKSAQLTGNNHSQLQGNELDNTLIGNAGNNTLMPGGGNNLVDGGAGSDTVVFSGPQSDYQLSESENGDLVVIHQTGEENILRSIEKLTFADKTVSVNQ